MAKGKTSTVETSDEDKGENIPRGGKGKDATPNIIQIQYQHKDTVTTILPLDISQLYLTILYRTPYT
jgi:hypothetical protein